MLISSFVLPHAGGVEQFVATVRRTLEASGDEVRVLACRPPAGPTSADLALPTRYIGSSGWPVPTGGWRAAWREIRGADVVIANNARHVLSVLGVLLARAGRVPALLVIHGSGAGPATGSGLFRAARRLFERSLARLAVRRSVAVSVSRAGVDGARRAYGVEAHYLPFPVGPLPPAAGAPAPAAGEDVRVVWVGRLYPEKDPVLAVRVVERLRARRPARLEIYGDGVLRAELERLATDRSWLTVCGQRPWREVQDIQARAHVCLSTSRADNVQVAVLEALCRGIPTVSTRVGDAPAYYASPALDAFCVAPGDADAGAAAIEALAAGYGEHRHAFKENAGRLRTIHDGAAQALRELIAHAGDRQRCS